jgi:glycosyltransferase involved in cell wall biosynthesis
VKVAYLTPSLSRHAGGLMDAVRRPAQQLAARGVEVQVLTLADDRTAEDLPAWAGVAARAVTRRGPRSFGYSPELRPALGRAAPDVLHSHGLWQYPSLLARDWTRRGRCRPHVVSPHGMLEPWALANARLKKRLAAVAFERANLSEAACIHALCGPEADAIRAYGVRTPVCVVPNGVDIPEHGCDAPAPWAGTVAEGREVLLYLGRIHPKKGLAGLLNAWAAVKRRGSGASWALVVAGWDQNGHEAELRRLGESLGVGGTVHFAGPLFGDAKHAAYANATAFALPSYSEGLPLVVLEAWAAGLPVLATPACNLPEGFEAGAALPILPDPGRIAEGLNTLFEMNAGERSEMGARGRELVRRRFTWDAVADDLLGVYRWVLDGGAPPAAVRS